jgi:lipoprotein-anchoring transpeptidase ErfK/SrfK
VRQVLFRRRQLEYNNAIFSIGGTNSALCAPDRGNPCCGGIVSRRIMQNRKTVGFAAALAIAIAAVAGTQMERGRAVENISASGPAADLSIRVSLADRMLYVERDGQVVKQFQVAVGQPKFPTPKGSFAIRHIVWNPHWIPPDAGWAKGRKPTPPGDPKNPMGRVKLFFQEPDYYIHGTHEVDSLGEAESHGCLRMRNAEVIQLAAMVMAAGGTPVEDGFIERVVNRMRSTQSVHLSRPVPVTIS